MKMCDLSDTVRASVREHRTQLAKDPFHERSYRALFEIYQAANATDAAFCVAAALVFLERASSEEAAFVERHRPASMVVARRSLDEGVLRRHVLHPDQDLYLTGILGLVTPAVAAWRAVALPRSLDPREIIDVDTDPSLFSRMAKYTKGVLDVAKPDVYLRPNDPGDMQVMNFHRDDSVRPSLVVFENMLRGKTEPHLVFALGRHLMDLYVPHYCRVALDCSPQNLKQVLRAVLRSVGLPVDGDSAALVAIAHEIKGRMQNEEVDRLESLVRRYVETGPSDDLQRWSQAVELTNYRVGLLLCQDLRIAAEMISLEPPTLGSRSSPRDKIADLVAYSISESYFTAREAIGVDVGTA